MLKVSCDPNVFDQETLFFLKRLDEPFHRFHVFLLLHVRSGSCQRHLDSPGNFATNSRERERRPFSSINKLGIYQKKTLNESEFIRKCTS